MGRMPFQHQTPSSGPFVAPLRRTPSSGPFVGPLRRTPSSDPFVGPLRRTPSSHPFVAPLRRTPSSDPAVISPDSTDFHRFHTRFTDIHQTHRDSPGLTGTPPPIFTDISPNSPGLHRFSLYFTDLTVFHRGVQNPRKHGFCQGGEVTGFRQNLRKRYIPGPSSSQRTNPSCDQTRAFLQPRQMP